MRYWLVTLLLAAGCCTHAPAPTPMQRRAEHARKRPQDMCDRILSDKRYPDWLKKNYAEWIRYAYDLEADPYAK